MKKHLLFCLICFLPHMVAAQFPIGSAALLLVNGAQAGSKALKNRANKPGEFVTYFRVGQDSIASKRTPENKLRGAASTDIQELEHYLAAANAKYRQPEQEFSFDNATSSLYIQRIRTQQPKWDVLPYEQEAQFYTQQSRARYTAAREREQLARQLAQQKAVARQDSLLQVARRRQATADSLRAVILARVRHVQDSLSALAQQQLATEDPAAAVEATTSQPKAVASSYSAVTRPTSTKGKVKAKVAPRPAVSSGPKVYICGNGRTEVYHASEGCSAMNRCTYQTLIMRTKEAQASGLRECMKCF
ncbi:hypothetical protein [Hymenobacter metallicola]|uniref:Uncharacterized protein n=1 Tax=Hymenobacter metallicola TaxID=2563114 RepID=A0A4Z0PY49_9BACT|nr:hypothetical protein [Hymenobacter metallicola]TGE22698.1 hypothetical protein E5K02_23485 [Hymenobacter metallicola]